MFGAKLCYVHQGYIIWAKYSENCNILEYYYNLELFYILICNYTF